MEEEKKTIVLAQPTKKDTNVRAAKTTKEKKIRVFIENHQVLIKETDYDIDKQWDILCNDGGDSESKDLRTIIYRNLSMKLHSYKTQDQKNTIFDPENFVDLNYVTDLLKMSNMQCFYCKERVQLLYKHVREPKQWTLDRINNDIGHNRGNVEIACLSCNLRRRCIHHERFLFTKQMKIVKT